MEPLIIIPARMASTRLPGKPLADICGEPMIVHVWRQATAAGIGPVWVACAEEAILAAVEHAGGQAILTPADLPSGTDRVKYAADKIDPHKKHTHIINVQGDMPAINPVLLQKIHNQFSQHEDCDIVTAVVETSSEREMSDPNVVKAVLASNGRALYFSRSAIPTGEGPVWHHVGLYGYTRFALDEFCRLPVSYLEKRERLEQLRALEAGMKLYAICVDEAPDGVDTPDDLERARELIGRKL